jgi:crossover junction endodeoxyribonuclease RuvC
MKILGIDPGYERCGIAIIEKKQGGKESVVFSTCIRTDSKLDFEKRLVILAYELEKIIIEFKPDTSAIEELYFAKNTKTAMKVAEARGVIRYILEKNNLKCTEYHPNAIKIAITGYGSATKENIAFMIPKLVTLPHFAEPSRGEKRLDDELDALAVAITHGANGVIHL